MTADPQGSEPRPSQPAWWRWVPPAVRRYLPSASAAPVADWREHVPAEWRRWFEESPAPRPQGRSLRVVTVDEAEPGDRWKALLDETWPAYRSWWRGGSGTRPDRAAAERALREHMPELVGLWEQLVARANGDDEVAAMLTLWNPPPFIVACSQIVVPDGDTGSPVLIRNYDYDPRLFEATVYRTGRVLGTGDCLWGLVDGVNDAGLAVSLTFGGRREVGDGFGVPLVIRYLLETCDSVEPAVAALERLPHQLSYNITLCDRQGGVRTVMVAPDRPANVTDGRATTNHPGRVEWPEHARWVRSVERLEQLEGMLAEGADAAAVVAAMTQPPLLARDWDRGFATLYTAAYRPVEGTLTYHWPTRDAEFRLDREPPAEVSVDLG